MPSGRRRKRLAREFTFKNGCRYQLLDGEAGMRRYNYPDGTMKTLWFGYYAHYAVDYFTGAPLTCLIASSSTQEYHSYVPLYDRLYEMLGDHPMTIAGDKGVSVASVFEQNTENGVASAFPFRKNGKNDREDLDDDLDDRHGIPRCQYWRADAARRLRAPDGQERQAGQKARLVFTCIQRRTAECSHPTKCAPNGVRLPRRQVLSCATNYRLLLPIWRNDDRYWVMRESWSKESSHQHFREIFRIAGKTNEGRPHRIGRGCHELRASVGVFITWFRICLREGWFKSHRLGSRMRPTTTANVPKGKQSFSATGSGPGSKAPTARKPSSAASAPSYQSGCPNQRRSRSRGHPTMSPMTSSTTWRTMTPPTVSG